jgi:cell division protein FtsB
MRNRFTNRDKKLLLYSGFFCVVLLILWIIFAPGRGAFDLFRNQKELKRIQAENIRLKDENKALQEEIDRLRNDPAYLEEKARKEYGMLKENEVLYIFKNKKK